MITLIKDGSTESEFDGESEKAIEESIADKKKAGNGGLSKKTSEVDHQKGNTQEDGEEEDEEEDGDEDDE